MDTRTARFLNDLNRQFYDACAPSFSDTRSAAWPGWKMCLDAFGAFCGEDDVIRVLDVACGNMRFESFLADELGNRPFAACAIDACEELARTGAEAFRLPVRFEEVADRPFSAECLEAGEVRFVPDDIVASVLEGGLTGFSGFDAAVCYGFFHHVPGEMARINLFDQLCDAVRPGGAVAVSLWRFLADERLARKASETTELVRVELAKELDFAELEQGDAFLGWQERSGVYRYVHSFSDEEVDALVEGVSSRAKLIARFQSDGRTGDLNEYLVLRKL